MCKLWSDCLKFLEKDLPPDENNVLLHTLHGYQPTPDTLALLAPNAYVVDFVQPHISKITALACGLAGDSGLKVQLSIGSADSIPSSAAAVESEGSPTTSTPEVLPETHQPDGEAKKKSAKLSGVSDIFLNNLNPDLTFDNYVEGKSNQLARASAIQVGLNPGKVYSPLFVFGGVGLGKTHLMHAIGNQILQQSPDANVVYLHSERFVNSMVTALRHNRIEEWKSFYRSVDANKTRSMEEFFHTYNVLLEDQKQVVMTGDRLPRDIENLEDRLQSRMGWGLSVEIEPPDVETRVAILRKKVEHLELDIPNDVAFFIARRFRSNIRDLEGALLRVVALLRLRNTTHVSLDFVEEALKDQLASLDKMVTIENIKKRVAEYFNIKVADLDSKSRRRNVTQPRQLAMMLSKELTNHSLPEIGEKFGGRDHTTVLHACRKMQDLIKSETRLEEAHRILLRTLRS